MQMQALVKVPLRRAHLAESIKKSRNERQSFVDLASFLEWLWHLTVVPERYCRQVCMWLMDKLATLQMADAMQTGQLRCLLCVLCLLGLLCKHLPVMSCVCHAPKFAAGPALQIDPPICLLCKQVLLTCLPGLVVYCLCSVEALYSTGRVLIVHAIRPLDCLILLAAAAAGEQHHMQCSFQLFAGH